jgi:hypothetical protein
MKNKLLKDFREDITKIFTIKLSMLKSSKSIITKIVFFFLIL